MSHPPKRINLISALNSLPCMLQANGLQVVVLTILVLSTTTTIRGLSCYTTQPLLSHSDIKKIMGASGVDQNDDSHFFNITSNSHGLLRGGSYNSMH